MSSLQFCNVTKTFGSTLALDALDLEVRDGELVTLLGPSGCGKTTALRIAAGFVPSDSGTVHMGGRDITRLAPNRRNMGMVFQSYSLFPNLTVAGNVGYGLRTRRVTRAERTQRIGEMLELVELSELAGRYPHQLSGGQQQRVALARALAIRPDVLLLDEPLSALDAKVRATLRAEIRRVQREVGITAIFVTHDQEEALSISDRVAVMSNGQIEQLGSPVDVYRDPSSPFVARFVGTMNQLPGVVLGPGTVEVGGLAIRGRVSGVAGQVVEVLFRPEDCALAHEASERLSSDDRTLGLSGTVVSTTFQGSSSVVSVRIDRVDQLISVLLPGGKASDFVTGDRVEAILDGSRLLTEPVASATSRNPPNV